MLPKQKGKNLKYSCLMMQQKMKYFSKKGLISEYFSICMPVFFSLFIKAKM
jgi:hypothetical protein